MNNQIIYKAFKTKIYPTKERIEYFNKCFGISRFAYNWYLNKMQEYYQLEIKKSFYELRKEFNECRELEFPFVLEVNSRVYGSALGNADTAYKMFFKKITKYPKFKSKKNIKQSFSLDRCKIIDNNVFSITGEKIVGKQNKYRIKTSENISFLKNKQVFLCTISYDGINYYVSFNYKEQQNKLYNKHKYDIVGIDLGLKTFAIQSDNKIAKLPKQKIIKIEKKIKKLNQILSKKQYNSNNYNKVKTKLNKNYKKITSIKNDFLHKYATYLCKNYKTIKIEDLHVSNMMKNKRLAKSVQRSNFYEFRYMLEYKSKIYNNELIVIDMWYASSKTCHSCGNKKKDLKLSDRIYHCDKCGYINDRDLNAALNIRDYK